MGLFSSNQKKPKAVKKGNKITVSFKTKSGKQIIFKTEKTNAKIKARKNTPNKK